MLPCRARFRMCLKSDNHVNDSKKGQYGDHEELSHHSLREIRIVCVFKNGAKTVVYEHYRSGCKQCCQPKTLKIAVKRPQVLIYVCLRLFVAQKNTQCK